VCYNFKKSRIVRTHYALRTYFGVAGDWHLKSWVVETSMDGNNSREVAREEDSEQFNGSRFTSIFTVAGGGECRFIRLVNIGRNHHWSDQVAISAWEIFGNLIEETSDPQMEFSLSLLLSIRAWGRRVLSRD
jgi:hypothetical protein